MKYVLGVLTLTVLLIAMSHGGAIASHDTQALDPAVESVPEPAGDSCSASESDIESQSSEAALPSCWNYQDQPCSTPGTSLRCQWQPFEPGRCGCTSSYVWSCG